MDAGAERVERELADRDAHAADAQVAQPEDALAVGHDDHVARRRTGAFRSIASIALAVRVGDEQAARPAVDVAVVLARHADHRRVDDRHHLGDVLLHKAVEERLVAILQAGRKI